MLIGTDADRIAEILGPDLTVFRAASLAEAVEKSGKLAVEGDRVLFSPACASFDMFRDYMDRGDQFRTLVQSLGEVL